MTFNRSLFFTVVGLLFAVLFIPLFVTNSLFFPYITGKNFAFRIIVELASLAWIMLILRDKSYRPKLNGLSIAVLIFAIIVGVADIFSSNPLKSFISNFERMEGWITIAHLALYFFLLTAVLRSWDFWKRLFQTSVAVSAIVCIQGFMQFADPTAQSGPRIYASFGNATYLAVYMLFHIFITLILLARHLKNRKENTKSLWSSKYWYTDFAVYIYLILMVLQTIILFLTATRGSILGLIGGLFLTGIVVAITEKEHKILRKISIGIIIVIFAIVGTFFLVKNTSFVKNNVTLGRLASISATDNTTKARFMIWNMAWDGVISSPKHFVIGWGQESFNYLFAAYYNPGMYGQEQWFDRAHDIVFDWLTAAGVLGLLSYLSIFVMTLYGIWRKSNFSSLEKGLLTGLLAGYFFHNLFVFDNITSYILFFMILAYVNSFNKKIDEPIHNAQKKEGKEINLSFQYAGMILAGIAFVVVFYQYDYKPITANLDLIKSLTQTQIVSANSSSNNVYTEENVNDFKEALSLNTIGLYETREQLLDVAVKSVGSNSDNAVKKDLVTLAESELSKQLKETPNDVRYYVLGGNFLQNLGDYKNAGMLLTKAKQLSPNKQSLLFAYGSNQFALKQYTDALATFKKAYELDKSFTEAKNLYALVALYVGQEDITNSLLGPGPIMDPRFLAAYKETKHYDLMMAYLEKTVASNPRDIQGQVSLAAGYVAIGNRTKAVATLQFSKTLTVDKGIQSQIDSFIKDIQAGKNPFESTTTAQ